MKNNGFTLVEMLAVIVLLGIIASITYVSISKTINKNNIENCYMIIDTLEDAANNYFSDNRYNDLVNSNYLEVSAKILYDNHYLTSNIEKNPIDKSSIDMNSIIVKVYITEDYQIEKTEVSGFSCN